MNKMTVTAAAASALLGLSMLTAGPAMANDSIYCQQQAEQDCSFFLMPYTLNWANCVEQLYQICMSSQAGLNVGQTLAVRES